MEPSRLGNSRCSLEVWGMVSVTVVSTLLCGHRIGQISFSATAPWRIACSGIRKVQGFVAFVLLVLSLSEVWQGEGGREIIGVMTGITWILILCVMYMEDCGRVERGWQLKSLLMCMACESLNFARLIALGWASGAIDEKHKPMMRMEILTATLTVVLAVTGLLQRADNKAASATDYATFDEDGGARREGVEMAEKGKTDQTGAGGTSKLPYEKSPEEKASWAEQWIFSWLTPTLVAGSKVDLQAKDLPAICDIDTSQAVCSRLISAWRQQLCVPEPSLFSALHSVFGGPFWVCAAHKITADVLALGSPMILQQLLKIMEDEGGASSSTVDCTILALLLFGAKMCFSVLWNQYFHRLFRIGWQMRSALAGLVYRKTLSMSSRSLAEHPLGDIVSLVSIDATRLGVAMGYMHYVWSSPFLIIISVFMLYNLLGPPALSGLALMVILTPANIQLAKAMEKINGKLMKLKDDRGNLLDEVLQGIRVIKCFAWETSFKDKIGSLREEEIGLMKKAALYYILVSMLWNGSNILVALCTFAAYSWSGQELRPNIAFTALALFNILRGPMAALPHTINMAIDCRTSLTRLLAFLNADQVDSHYHLNERSQDTWNPTEARAAPVSPSAEPAIRICKGNFLWPQQREAVSEGHGSSARAGQTQCVSSTLEPWALRDVDIQVNKGERIFVFGPVGAGKSSLLSAILGSIEKKSGTVELRGMVAYVPQQHWIFNATVRENILFGMPFDEVKYARVVEACALLSDFKVLPGGDSTEIGEKGINLSGGQKARVSLARACYQDSDIYLLDDPLAAVDVHVARQLMDECILGILKDKTVVLVTHQVQYLPMAGGVIAVKEGAIVASGSFENVSKEYPNLIFALDHKASSDSRHEATDAVTDTFDKDSEIERTRKNQDKDGTIPSTASKGGSTEEHDADAFMGDAKKSTEEADGKHNVIAQKNKLVEEEKMESGAVGLAVWTSLAKCIGTTATFTMVSLFVCSQFLQTGSDGWLSVWSSAVVAHEGSQGEGRDIGGPSDDREPFNTSFYLAAYAAISLSSVVIISASSFSVVSSLLRASRQMHQRMLERILYAPTSFFDTTPTGRILNRFTGDLYQIDNELRRGLEAVFLKGIKLFFVLAVVLYVTPLFAIIIAIMAVVYLYVQRFYRQTSRQITRIQTVTKSPILSLLSETIGGQGTIRAFEAQKRFIETFDKKNDDFTLAYATLNTSNRWLQIRLEFIGNLSVGFSALLAILQSGGGAASAALVGLSITYALDVTDSLNWVIRNFTVVEGSMVSAERIAEYSNIDVETPHVPSKVPAKDWPSKGELQFCNVVMKYREDLPPALRGVSFITGPSEKVGVVGRTGAGKSSLAVAIWRMTEICEGRILLDGVDIRQMGTADLRERLSIIPQDPIIFSGSVRTNVDPLGICTDDQVWDVLEKVKMKDYLSKEAIGASNRDETGLDLTVQYGGSNMSTGQRQLLCLARALLRSSRFILIDEATASVDMTTDFMIQKTMKECFSYATVLTIAHRLATVMECDTVLVMGEGKVLESGNPKTLKADPTSHFHSMTE